MLSTLRTCSRVPLRSWLGIWAWISAVLLASAAQAVVILGATNGTGNTTAPADDFGFENVGVTDTGLNAIYLGDGWVLTANHVGARPITLLGVQYQPVAGSGVRLLNPTNPNGTPPDLFVYRINGLPPLPSPALSNATPTVNEVVSCTGHGWTREPTQTTWSGTFVENPPLGQVVFRGYKKSLSLPFARRWGTNAVSTASANIIDTTAFEVTFDQSGGTANELQAVVGDSGGGCFAKRGSSWQLVGVMFAMVTFGDGPGGQPDQPADTAIFGNLTAAADVFFYRSEIESLTPPPGPVPALPPVAAGVLAALLVLTAGAGYLRPSSTRR
jgi:hypothetical protein